MHLSRTRFARDIVAEFLPPYAEQLKAGKKAKPSRKVIILAGGMPGFPPRKEVLEYFSSRGYWVFNPRYRGTWESGGKFLKRSPHLDIKDVIDALPKGFVDLWSGEVVKVKPSEVALIGSSFGGPAALLNAADPRVTKVVCMAPVIDWTVPFPAEPLDWMEGFTREAFGMGYRFDSEDWRKLGRGSFYDPVSHIKKIDGKKVYIIHAIDDEVVPIGPTKAFAKQVGCKLTVLKEGGHGGMSLLLTPSIVRRVHAFLKK